MLRFGTLLVLFATGISSAWASNDVQFLGHATIHQTELRLGDVVDLARLDAASRAEIDSIVLTHVKGLGSTVFDVNQLASLVRAKAPGVGSQLSYRAGQQVVIDRLAPPPGVGVPTLAAGRVCWQTARPLAADAAVQREDIEAAPCATSSNSEGMLRYDRKAQVIRTRDALSAGVFLGPLPMMRLAGVTQGQEFDAQISIGHVTVSRRMTAAQDASVGTRVFALTADGDLLSIHLAQDKP